MSPPPHALSCFTSTASPATLPACTSSLAALPSLAALFFSCSTSVTCSTFLLLQHFLHLQHFRHLRPADLARLARRPAPLTSPAVLRVLPAVLRLQHLRPTDQRLLHLHGTCFLSFPRHLLSARAHSGTCKHGANSPTQPAVAHASSSPSRARCASSSPPSAPRSRLRRCAARREMARPRRRPAIFACLTKRDVAFQFIYIILYGCLRRARDSSG